MNLVTEQAGDVSFVGVGHVGIRARSKPIFVNLIPLALMKLLSPALTWPDLPRSVCVAVTNAARPSRASRGSLYGGRRIIHFGGRGARRADLPRRSVRQHNFAVRGDLTGCPAGMPQVINGPSDKDPGRSQ